MKARLFVWVFTLSILTSLVIIEGTWIVEALHEWPPHKPNLTDSKLSELEDEFEGDVPPDWEARLAAWEKTPDGKKEMRMWRKR